MKIEIMNSQELLINFTAEEYPTVILTVLKILQYIPFKSFLFDSIDKRIRVVFLNAAEAYYGVFKQTIGAALDKNLSFDKNVLGLLIQIFTRDIEIMWEKQK